jgi:hypothetical protein
MIAAYAVLHCDHAGCPSSMALREPLRFGQLNPLQVADLNGAAGSAGWVARWTECNVRHYCPEHATETKGVTAGED